MQHGIQIKYSNLDRSTALDALITEKAELQMQRHSDIMNCQVTVESVHSHRANDNQYSVRLLVAIPEKSLVVSKHSSADAYTAVCDAFHALHTQLEEHAGRSTAHNGIPQT